MLHSLPAVSAAGCSSSCQLVQWAMQVHAWTSLTTGLSLLFSWLCQYEHILGVSKGKPRFLPTTALPAPQTWVLLELHKALTAPLATQCCSPGIPGSATTVPVLGLDYGSRYRSPTLHLLVTSSPATSTCFSHSSIYSLPSGSQMLQLNTILLFQFSVKYVTLPWCSSSDPLQSVYFACKHPACCLKWSHCVKGVPQESWSLFVRGTGGAGSTHAACPSVSDSQASELLTQQVRDWPNKYTESLTVQHFERFLFTLQFRDQPITAMFSSCRTVTPDQAYVTFKVSKAQLFTTCHSVIHCRFLTVSARAQPCSEMVVVSLLGLAIQSHTSETR